LIDGEYRIVEVVMVEDESSYLTSALCSDLARRLLQSRTCDSNADANNGINESRLISDARRSAAGIASSVQREMAIIPLSCWGVRDRGHLLGIDHLTRGGRQRPRPES
jgi:hypothetical protein